MVTKQQLIFQVLFKCLQQSLSYSSSLSLSLWLYCFFNRMLFLSDSDVIRENDLKWSSRDSCKISYKQVYMHNKTYRNIIYVRVVSLNVWILDFRSKSESTAVEVNWRVWIKKKTCWYFVLDSTHITGCVARLHKEVRNVLRRQSDGNMRWYLKLQSKLLPMWDQFKNECFPAQGTDSARFSSSLPGPFFGTTSTEVPSEPK